jgi:C-terminal processing protease CtpA/Prc
MFVLLAAMLIGASAGFADEKPFGSIGLQVVPVATGELVVLRAVDGSPALTAAIRPGDLIVEVDGVSLVGSIFSEVVTRYLWGEPGSSVTLKYLRPGVVGVNSVTLKRVPSARPQQATPGVKLLTPDAMNGKP